ncbi:MAG: WbqC family protein [Flavobacteriales bacterium]
MSASASSPSRLDRSVYTGVRLGIMQPYFFPYLGYFSLIACTDRWIVFDPVQYIRKGWMNRNRVLKKGGGWKYIGVTVEPHDRSTLIKDIHLPSEPDRFDRIIRHLDHYKAVHAPHYDAVLALLEECLRPESQSLVAFNTNCLERTCSYLGLAFDHEVYSDMALAHTEAREPGDWALHISRSLGAGAYVNPPGGRGIFDLERFRQAGVKLLYLEQELPPYEQRTNTFEPGLSIIDVMMFNAPPAIRDMLQQHRLVSE